MTGLGGERLASITNGDDLLVYNQKSESTQHYVMGNIYSTNNPKGLVLKGYHYLMWGLTSPIMPRVVYLSVLVLSVLLLVSLYIRNVLRLFGGRQSRWTWRHRAAAPVVLIALANFIFTTACGPAIYDTRNTEQTLLSGDSALGLPSGTFYYHANHIGSNSVVTNSSGAEVTRIQYLPYGEIDNTNSTGQDYITNKFTGQERDNETSLYNYGARFYDPTNGSFLIADTIVPSGTDTQSYNRYMYVRGNPIKYTDPSGHGPMSGPDDDIYASDPTPAYRPGTTGGPPNAPLMYSDQNSEADLRARNAELVADSVNTGVSTATPTPGGDPSALDNPDYLRCEQPPADIHYQEMTRNRHANGTLSPYNGSVAVLKYQMMVDDFIPRGTPGRNMLEMAPGGSIVLSPLHSWTSFTITLNDTSDEIDGNGEGLTWDHSGHYLATAGNIADVGGAIGSLGDAAKGASRGAAVANGGEDGVRVFGHNFTFEKMEFPEDGSPASLVTYEHSVTHDLGTFTTDASGLESMLDVVGHRVDHAVVNTPNGRVFFTHGSKDGGLATHPDNIVNFIRDNPNGRVVFCNNEQVLARRPWVAPPDRVLYPSNNYIGFDQYTGITIDGAARHIQMYRYDLTEISRSLLD